MADIGLRRHERHRHLVALLLLPERGVDDEGELVSRPVAGGALHRADHHRAGILDQRVEAVPRLNGVIDLADRLGVRGGPEPRNLVEGEVGTRRDDQIVVFEVGTVVEHDAVLRRVNARRTLRPEVDALFRKHRLQLHRNILGLAPADGDPWIGGDERIAAAEIDHRQLVVAAHLGFHLVGHDDPAETRTEHDDMRHDTLRSLFAPRAVSQGGAPTRHLTELPPDLFDAGQLPGSRRFRALAARSFAVRACI